MFRRVDLNRLGDRDCMDWTDEYFYNYGKDCPFQAKPIECDEHLCAIKMYSCGDGECIRWESRMAFQRLSNVNYCFTKRNLNYMCEISQSPSAWTLENGLCWPDKGYDDLRYSQWNITDLSNEEKCSYLFRCLLSDNHEYDCPCDHLDCKEMMRHVCSNVDQLIVYPPKGLISASILIYYNFRMYEKTSNFYSFFLIDNIKCRGYLGRLKGELNLELTVRIDLKHIVPNPLMNQLICHINDPLIEQDFSSSFQHDKLCWNGSLTFNGRLYGVHPDLCVNTGQCISQYRIHDGTEECPSGHDEKIILKESLCTGNVGKHHFQCYKNEQKCLPLEELGTGISQCSNGYDESYYGNGLAIRDDLSCKTNITKDCGRLRDYIEQSSLSNMRTNDSLNDFQRIDPSNRIGFRSFCDSFWDFDSHWDELSSSCQYWICPLDEYQCRTGQCIQLNWLCDGEWDCADASDEEAIFLIQPWSTHNIRLSNFSKHVNKCRRLYFIDQTPFSNHCNVSFEFGCYRSGVSLPLNIESLRPCINLTQIGDGKEDCYNAYDERNTFPSKSRSGGMWGFHFQCHNVDMVYTQACRQDRMINCTDQVCSLYRDKDGSCSDEKDFICLNDNQCQKGIRCNGISECSHGEDEYWCPKGSFENHQRYRYDKYMIIKQQNVNVQLITYPEESFIIRDNQSRSTISNDVRSDDFLFSNDSYKCNRGISVMYKNDIRCFCPPAYFGSRCQYFSDRISVVVQVDRKSMPKSFFNVTMKIQANLIFNGIIIDQHEFDLLPTLETMKSIKHRFYLLYSRSNLMIEHKRNRYFNRTDIIINHPYAVHFLLFALHQNNRPKLMATWNFPIYFDYLPSFRLAVVLKFPSYLKKSSFDSSSLGYSNKSSMCVPIFNTENSSFCSCVNGHYGINCERYELLCDTFCADKAFCQVSEEGKVHCICPLGHFGARCRLKYDQCKTNTCDNDGTCFPSNDRSGEQPFLCYCPKQFYGNRCENEKSSVRIYLNLTKPVSARATVVQLYEPTPPSLILQIKYQKVHEGLPTSMTSFHADDRAPILGMIKIYEDFEHAQYFVVYWLKQSQINITSTPQHCPHVSTFVAKDLFHWNRNLSDMDRSVPLIFQFHHICRNDTTRFCFYDENYLCLCKSLDSRAECFIHNTKLDHCDQCLSGGKCLQNDPIDSNDFRCFCPSCHQGHRCQFNSQAFGFTFDSLLARYSLSVKVIYFSLIILLFLLASVNNLCSLITFKRPAPRKFGTGTYLLFVSCFNQLAFICLLIKFIQITFGISSVVSCRLVTYLLSVFTRSTYWLTTWVTIDRMFVILFPNSSRLKNPRLAIFMSFVTLVLLLILHVHELIYYTSIQDYRTSSPICVANMNTDLIAIYNRVSTPIHYILPFFIQTISITLLIILAARSRVRVSGSKSTFYQTLKTQFQNQKELYVTPALVIFSISPQVIATFTLACKELNPWQGHILLCVYLFSYAPQVLGFILYILPSSAYKKEFGETLLGKKFFKSTGKNNR